MFCKVFDIGFSEILSLLSFVYLMCMHGAVHARLRFLWNYKACTALCALNLFCNYFFKSVMGSTHIKPTEYAFKYKISLMCMHAHKFKNCIFTEKGNIGTCMHVQKWNILFQSIFRRLYMCTFHHTLKKKIQKRLSAHRAVHAL